MTIFFWILWVIDLFIWLICAYETFFTRSNSSMAIPFVLMTVCVGLSLWLRSSKPEWALAVAGIPAGLAVLYLIYGIIGSMVKKDWR